MRKKISNQKSGKGSDMERLGDFSSRVKHKVFYLLLGTLINKRWETIFQGPQGIWFQRYQRDGSNSNFCLIHRAVPVLAFLNNLWGLGTE